MSSSGWGLGSLENSSEVEESWLPLCLKSWYFSERSPNPVELQSSSIFSATDGLRSWQCHVENWLSFVFVCDLNVQYLPSVATVIVLTVCFLHILAKATRKLAVFGLLAQLLPLVMQCLSSTEPRLVTSSLMSVIALLNGAADLLSSHASDLIPLLLSLARFKGDLVWIWNCVH